MNRAVHSFGLAMCLSLALHGAIVWTFMNAMIRNPIWLAGWDRTARVDDSDDAQVAFVDPRTRLPDTMLGAMDGKAHAIDPSEGENPLEARKGDQDQQFLSRDPEGVGKIGAEPSPSVLPMDEDAPSAAAPFGVESKQLSVPDRIAREAPITHIPSPEVSAPAPNPIADPNPGPGPGPSPPPTPAAKAASNLPPADPAPMAQSETDPYSVVGAVRFRPGKADVQFGRKHKLVRPRFDLAALASMQKLRSPIVIALKLELDAQGNVTHVEITRHSGSDDIDQAITLAAYKWWLEPSKDKAGNPVADSVPFVIRLD